MLPTSFSQHEFFGKNLDVIIFMNQLDGIENETEFIDNNIFARKVKRQAQTFLKMNLNALIMNMILSGILNFDGTVDLKYNKNSNKRDLWAYIYYIWIINVKNFTVLQQMSETIRGVYIPRPRLFVKTVHDVLIQYGWQPSIYLTSLDLLHFINMLFHLTQGKLRVPKLTKLFVKLELMIDNKENGLHERINKVQKELENRHDELRSLSAKTYVKYLNDYVELPNSQVRLEIPYGSPPVIKHRIRL